MFIIMELDLRLIKMGSNLDKLLEEEKKKTDEKTLKLIEDLQKKRGINEETAIEILKDSKLLDKILFEISKKVVGEVDTIKTIFLCACGRLVEKANLTSYNLFVNDESGVGKDWVTDKTLDILPDGHKIKRTRISPNALTYWHNPKFDPDWTWDGKVLYLEDISSSVFNHEVLKVMASSGSHATILKDQTPYDIEIKGKPVIVVTSAAVTPSPENLRRFTILNLDSSVEQTKAIIERQARLACQGINLEYDERIKTALSFLKRVKVKVPFAEDIVDKFPKENILMRTHFQRFIDYIKASAALHQYQREVDDEGFIEAQKEDYEYARIALLKTSSNQYMIPLTKEQKKLLEIVKNLGESFYSVNDIEPHVTFISDRWLRAQLDKLAGYGFLEKSTTEQDNRNVIAYRYSKITDVSIPTWDELHN